MAIIRCGGFSDIRVGSEGKPLWSGRRALDPLHGLTQPSDHSGNVPGAQVAPPAAIRHSSTRHVDEPTLDPGPRANLLLCYVIGRWQQYAKSGFKRLPSELWEKQWPLLASR